MYLGEEEEGRGGGGGKHAALNHAGMLTTAHLSPRGVSRKTHYESLAQIRLIEYDEWRARARAERILTGLSDDDFLQISRCAG